MFGTQSVIHTSIGGQLYVYEEQDVFSQLTPSQQHLYLNEGYIESASSMQAAGDYPVRGGYVAHYNANEPEYFGLVHQPDPKPHPRKRDIFEDDDWSKPLYDETLVSVNDIDRVLLDGIKVDDMTASECLDWLDQFDQREEIYIKRRAKDVKNRLEMLQNAYDTKHKKLAEMQEAAIVDAHLMGMDCDTAILYAYMFSHQDEWWESKQIRR